MFTLTEHDLEAIDLLKDFTPQQIFDAHVHLHVASTMPNQYHPDGAFYREYGTYDNYISDMSPFFSHAKDFRLNIMPMPDVAMNDRANKFREIANNHVFDEFSKHTEVVVSPYIMHGDTAEEIWNLATQPGVRALKCYCFSATSSDHEFCTIDDFLPESAWDIANQLHLADTKGVIGNTCNIIASTRKNVLNRLSRSFISYPPRFFLKYLYKHSFIIITKWQILAIS